MSERVSLPSMACPFCRHYDETEVQPYDHIANHLHEFALRALPWSENPNDGSYRDTSTSVQTEGWRGKVSRSTIDNDEDHRSEHDGTTLSRNETLKLLLEQISDQAATSLRIGIPEIAKGYQDVLEQLPTLLDRAKTIALDSATKDQPCHSQSADAPEITSENREEMWKESLDGYIRPMVRIQGIVDAFSEQMKDIPEREAKELEDSLQAECAALRQLLQIDDPPIQETLLGPGSSEPATENVFGTQRTIEAVVEKRPVASSKLHPFFKEAFQDQITLTTAQIELKESLKLDLPVRCKVEQVERRFRKWQRHNVGRPAAASIGSHLHTELARFSELAARPTTFFALLPIPDLIESVCGGMVMVAACMCTQRLPDALLDLCEDALTTIISALTTELFVPDIDEQRNNSEELSRMTAAVFTVICRLLIAVLDKVSLWKSSCKFHAMFSELRNGFYAVGRSQLRCTAQLKSSFVLSSSLHQKFVPFCCEG